MKYTTFIAAVAFASSMLAASCCTEKTVDETVETDRYTLHIQDKKTYCAATGNSIVSFYNTGDTVVLSNTIPQMAYFLVSHRDLDSTTMYYINLDKQVILPTYVYTIIDHDTLQPLDYIPLVQTLIDRGLLRTDTTYEPLQMLAVFDSARLNSHKKTELLDDDPYFTNIASVVVQLQEQYRKPVSPAPGVELDVMFEKYHIGDNGWEADSLWLVERGLRVVPDSLGRQMRIIEINREKGRI